MNTLWYIGLIALWCVVLLNLVLTLRVVRRLRNDDDMRTYMATREARPDLVVGEPAPTFRAKMLTGEPVQLSDFAGQSVAFIFVSPHCSTCRKELPLLARLAPHAKAQAGVEIVLTSDGTAAETLAWLQSVRDEQHVELDLPMVIAPLQRSAFHELYNPRGLYPYYCLIDAQGNVQSRDPLGMGAWPSLQQAWEQAPTSRLTQRLLNRYR